jgi:hypothetical protein
MKKCSKDGRRAAGAAQVYAEAAPKGVAHPVGECDRSGEGEAGGGFSEGEHNGRYVNESLNVCIDS